MQWWCRARRERAEEPRDPDVNFLSHVEHTKKSWWVLYTTSLRSSPKCALDRSINSYIYASTYRKNTVYVYHGSLETRELRKVAAAQLKLSDPDSYSHCIQSTYIDDSQSWLVFLYFSRHPRCWLHAAAVDSSLRESGPPPTRDLERGS